ncbi:MAG: uracil phosphoribosyltransferase [Bacteroidota bacterium]
MELHIINQTNSIVNHFLAELRDVNVQGDRMRFRKNLQRLGAIMAYEFSKTLSYNEQVVKTPMDITKVPFYTESLYLITILRAGMPFYEGFLEVFDHIDSGFVGAYRVSEGKNPSIQLDYLASDHLAGKEVMLIDPMLATGNSLIAAYNSLVKHVGTPAKVHFFTIIGTAHAIDNLQSKIDIDGSIWVGAVDPALDENAYIVPGLGDAGDLSYGPKI